MTNVNLHFFDLRHVGSPSLGQPVAFDSLLISAQDHIHKNWHIRLRPDVVFNPKAVEQSDALNHVRPDGITEYEWVRAIESIFYDPLTLHVGIGCSGRTYDHLRYALYRCLSPHPAYESTKARHMLDLVTLLRATAFLRPSALPFEIDPSWSDERIKNYVFQLLPGASESDTVFQLASMMRSAHPKLFSYGVKCTSTDRISEVLGLVKGQIESLAMLKPVFMTHDLIAHPSKCGVFLPMGTDPEYPSIVYMVDLNCDLSELIENADQPTKFFRDQAFELSKPIVRVSLNRLPFVVGLGALDSACWNELGLSRELVAFNAKLLRGQQELSLTLCEFSAGAAVGVPADPEFQLISSDYRPADLELLRYLHEQPMAEWEKICRERAHDQRIARLAESLIRRSGNPILDSGADKAWRSHCANRLTNKVPDERVAALTAYSKNVIGKPSAPIGLLTVCQHWLDTIES
jgi:exonuclease I